jgi:hypothetical protein
MQYSRLLGKIFARPRITGSKQLWSQNLQLSLQYNCAATTTTRGASRIITTPAMEQINTTERLTRLRELMKQHKLDVYSM